MVSEDRDPIVVQLQAARKAMGLSLEQFGQRFYIPGMVIGSYERGDRNPPLSQLRRWADALDHDLLAVGPSGASGAATWSEYAVEFDTYIEGKATQQRIDCRDAAEAARVHDAMPSSRLVQRLVTAGDWEKL